MNITTKTGLVGFILALSVLNIPKAQANITSHPSESSPTTIEQRLTRLSTAIRQRDNTLGNPTPDWDDSQRTARWINGSRGGWANRRYGGGGFVNRRGGGGFVNRGYGGGFANRSWPNGWRNGGGFLNRRW